jgi:threonine dehydratase
MAGAGTSTQELLDDVGPLDLVVIPAGGGGQLAGGAIAAAGAAKPPRLIGAEPAAVGQFSASLAAGRPVQVPVRQTIADGQQLPSPGNLTFAVIRTLSAGVVGVEDAQMLAAMRLLFERQKLVVEPSGSSALAAVLSRRIEVRGLRVGVILSGGNIAIDRFLQLMTEPIAWS